MNTWEALHASGSEILLSATGIVCVLYLLPVPLNLMGQLDNKIISEVDGKDKKSEKTYDNPSKISRWERSRKYVL